MMEVIIHPRTEVDSLHHTASGQYPQKSVQVWELRGFSPVQRISQRLGCISLNFQILSIKGRKAPNETSQSQWYCPSSLSLFLRQWSHCGALDGLEPIEIGLSPPPKYWDKRHALACPARISILSLKYK